MERGDIRDTAEWLGAMSASPILVRFYDDSMWVDLSDGRSIGAPLARFPLLMRATPAQRSAVELSRTGLRWDEIDEDISVACLLAGRGDVMASTERVG